MVHGIVINRIVPYYGSGKKLRHTIGYTGPELDDPNYPYPMSYNTYQYNSGAFLHVGLAYATSSTE